MKQILFRPSSFVLAFTLFFSFTSCKKQTSDPPKQNTAEEMTIAQAGTKPVSIPGVLLRVTINDASGNKITSDGLGDYVHGVDNVRAELDGTGSFQFDCRYQSKPGQSVPLIRGVNFNFSDPLPGSPIIALPFSGNFQTGNRMITNSSSLTPYTPIQNMANGTSQCITLATGSTYSTKTEPLPIWRVNFHGNYEDISTSPTAFATITRISNTQWTIAPGNCNISSNMDVGALRNGDILYGYYHMPFFFTLTVK